MRRRGRPENIAIELFDAKKIEIFPFSFGRYCEIIFSRLQTLSSTDFLQEKLTNLQFQLQFFFSRTTFSK